MIVMSMNMQQIVFNFLPIAPFSVPPVLFGEKLFILLEGSKKLGTSETIVFTDPMAEAFCQLVLSITKADGADITRVVLSVFVHVDSTYYNQLMPCALRTYLYQLD